MQQFDLIIIGGGRASNLALRASNIGKKVALIEKDKLGGTCPNKGCVPSKLLIGYAHTARAIKESSRHFIKSTIDNIDLEKIFDEVNEYVSNVDPRYESRLNENITLFRGEGSFVNDNTIEVNNKHLTAPNIVIGTGTRPIEAFHEGAWTSDDIFPLKEKIPSSITIVGSGFIACELANFFDAVGVKTKLLVRGETLLRNEDKDISNIFKEEVTKHLDISFNTTIKELKKSSNSFNMVLIDTNKNETIHSSEALLYAVGRKANSDTLKLENTSIETNKKGFIKRDKNMQTSAKGVYVVGDAAGDFMLQHAASYEVNYLYKILYENEKTPLSFKYMPHAVFTDPEIASVGYTEQDLENTDMEYVCNITNWLASAKAMSTKLKYPKIKMIVNPNTYEILGCHMIGPDSATMIHQVLAVLHINNDVRHLKNMLYIHPALSEALLPAAVEIIKKVQEKNKIE